MNLFQAFILGLIEGITEFLPISSTGHLLIAQNLLGLKNSAGLDAYLIVIQFGAIAAILFLYPKRIAQLFQGAADLFKGQMRSSHTKLLSNLAVAFFPAALVGLLLDNWIERHLFNSFSVALALAAGACIMFAVRPRKETQTVDQLTIPQSLTIGLWQILSLWPGMSRSMTTLVGGSLVGLKRASAAEFSFILGVLILTAAGLYKFIKFHEQIFALGLGPVLVGLLAAFISALIVVKLFVGLLNRFGLVPWAWYRLVVAAVILLGVR